MRSVCRLVVLIAATGTALAEPGSKTAAATALFDQGRALQKSGDFTGACAAFEQSQKLEAAYGTLYNLAGCYVHMGRIASAWAAYRAVADRDANAVRRDDAERQANDLAPRLPKLIITVSAKPPGLVVLVDGLDFTNLIGVATPIDLGLHHLVAHAQGYKTWEGDASVTVEGTTATATIEILQLPAKPIPVTQRPVAVERVSRVPQRSWAAFVASTGGALAVTGIVVGELAKRELDAGQHLCSYEFQCVDPTAAASAAQLVRKAESRADLSTGLVAAGGVAVAVGVVLWLTAPAPITTRLLPGTAATPWGVSYSGSF